MPIFDRFDADNQGWKVSPDAVSYYNASGGNPGGFVAAVDNATEAWYFIAPEHMLLEAKRGYGKSLSFDLKQSAIDSQFNGDDIVLTDGIITLVYNTSYNPATTWTSYLVKLDEVSGWKKGSQKASKEDFLKVLSKVSGLKIRGEYRAGPDRGGLDNVSIK
ncbi:laminin B domain-containing protein [Fibrella aquatica]|uniref:laminin B domain-containing protein n=1 Tax=Fibrella aquatica TaxID=3242487 RepID=UPI003520769C